MFTCILKAMNPYMSSSLSDQRQKVLIETEEQLFHSSSSIPFTLFIHFLLHFFYFDSRIDTLDLTSDFS